MRKTAIVEEVDPRQMKMLPLPLPSSAALIPFQISELLLLEKTKEHIDYDQKLFRVPAIFKLYLKDFLRPSRIISA